ncbi:LamG-like jellyroll fold domain-containing protein [Nostoc sp. DSM 114167]|jgi:thiamine pyrophosphokinase|uniref:LamG-like jellyroll fold domain-containing protein n=1 Tax=Nostoc sp. DSM 114167 TaxID=3439050 RepID=UPI004045BE48
MPLHKNPIINTTVNNITGVAIPTTIKTTAENSDYFIGIDANGELYKISKANLLAGLSTGGGTVNSDVNFANVYLLLHGEGSTVLDSSAKAYNIAGNASLSSTWHQFGSQSIFFNNSYLSVANPGDMVIGTQDFCLEAFIRLTAYPVDYAVIFNNFLSSSQRFVVYLANNTTTGENGLTVTNGVFNVTQSISSASLNSLGWNLNQTYYIAAKRINGQVSLWRDGVQIASGAMNTDFNYVANTFIGAYSSNNYFFAGYMDEFRFSLGVSRNVSVIPSTAFPDN